MFRRIMVPVDLSNRDAPALGVAVRMAQQSGGSVTLLHVIETLQDTGYDEYRSFYDRLERQAREKMQRLWETFIPSGVEVMQQIVFGRRAEAIIHYAMKHTMDLIVLTSHKIDLQRPGEGWGTISHRVGILSQCPVLLVK